MERNQCPKRLYLIGRVDTQSPCSSTECRGVSWTSIVALTRLVECHIGKGRCGSLLETVTTVAFRAVFETGHRVAKLETGRGAKFRCDVGGDQLRGDVDTELSSGRIDDTSFVAPAIWDGDGCFERIGADVEEHGIGSTTVLSQVSRTGHFAFTRSEEQGSAVGKGRATEALVAKLDTSHGESSVGAIVGARSDRHGRALVPSARQTSSVDLTSARFKHVAHLLQTGGLDVTVDDGTRVRVSRVGKHIQSRGS